VRVGAASQQRFCCRKATSHKGPQTGLLSHEAPFTGPCPRCLGCKPGKRKQPIPIQPHEPPCSFRREPASSSLVLGLRCWGSLFSGLCTPPHDTPCGNFKLCPELENHVSTFKKRKSIGLRSSDAGFYRGKLRRPFIGSFRNRKTDEISRGMEFHRRVTA
jgi:hypothetical protein